MTIDISRNSFDPLRNRSGVLMQQGRVQLDGDWNEWGDIQNRRWRSQSLDLMGLAYVSPQTPDAFKITNVAGALWIGAGRLYVDGLVGENHGALPLRFDPVLEEQTGSGPIGYADQPFRPGLSAPPPPPPSGRHLVYLDLWSRTETYLQSPELIEIAVGVDTTARTQTVWQTRILQNVGGNVVCNTPDAGVAGWQDAIRPSDGRLTTRNVVPLVPTDPCLLPPGAGYRGLENRTYRVEIHDNPSSGVFRFKWSQVNAVVATPVARIAPGGLVLTVESVSRDDVLGFAAGDWAEILDDRMELEGQPGLMRRILSVDPATSTITLDTAAIPAAAFPLDGQGRPNAAWHTRIRKWDQNGLVKDSGGATIADLSLPTSPGVAPVSAGTAITLEPGIEITFSLAATNGCFRVGDYWIFTARTADASIQELTSAPPAGTHHHYCRLAVIDSSGTAIIGQPLDCRPPALDDCCCISVRPGQDINAAIRALPPEGGCICLKSGLHLTQTVVIDRSNVHLLGESPGVTVRGVEAGPVLSIGPTSPRQKGVWGIRICEIAFEYAPDAPDAFLAQLAMVGYARDIRFHDVVFRGARDGTALGLTILQSTDVVALRSEFEDVLVGVYAIGSDGLDVCDCRIDASLGAGVYVQDSTGRTRIEGNRIVSGFIGVALNSGVSAQASAGAFASRIVGNDIVLPREADAATSDPVPGIDVGEDGCLIAENRLSYGAPNTVGIRVIASDVMVAENACASTAGQLPAIPPTAIQVGDTGTIDRAGPARVTVRDNLITGAQMGLTAQRARDLAVLDNVIDGEGAPVGWGVFTTSADGARIEGNVVRGAGFALVATQGRQCVMRDNHIEASDIGVFVIQEAQATIRENRIEAPGSVGIGIWALAGRCEVTGNRIANAAWAAAGSSAIVAWDILGEWVVEDNEVTDTGVSPTGAVVAPAYGVAGDLIQTARVAGNIVSYSSPLAAAREDRALRIRGRIEMQQPLLAGKGDAVLQVLGNKFIGSGFTALVEIGANQNGDQYGWGFERVIFNDNYCAHIAAPNPAAPAAGPPRATVSLVCRYAVVMGNQIKAMGRSYPSVIFRPGTVATTFVGNITEGGAIGAPDFPTPELSFNIQA